MSGRGEGGGGGSEGGVGGGGGREGERGDVGGRRGAKRAKRGVARGEVVERGTRRTGVTVEREEGEVTIEVAMLRTAVGSAAMCGFTRVLLVGDRYLRVVGTAE